MRQGQDAADTVIRSMQNSRIKRIVRLTKKAKDRREAGLFVIDGIRLFLDTPEDFLKEVFVSERLWKRLSEPDASQGTVSDAREQTLLREKLLRHDAVPVSDDVMEKISETQTPQGVAAIVRMPHYTMEDLMGPMGPVGPAFQETSSGAGKAPLLLITEDVRDPGNLGTMFRTAEAAGVTGILLNRGTVDLFNPKTVRATMSAIFRMPFVITEDLIPSLAGLKKAGVRLYAAHLGGKDMYDAPDYTGPSAFLIGNEGNGLSFDAAEMADEKILIPMEGKIESLNAAMSAGILLYEASRQRRKQ